MRCWPAAISRRANGSARAERSLKRRRRDHPSSPLTGLRHEHATAHVARTDRNPRSPASRLARRARAAGRGTESRAALTQRFAPARAALPRAAGSATPQIADRLTSTGERAGRGVESEPLTTTSRFPFFLVLLRSRAADAAVRHCRRESIGSRGRYRLTRARPEAQARSDLGCSAISLRASARSVRSSSDSSSSTSAASRSTWFLREDRPYAGS